MSEILNNEYWNNRYATHQTGWDIGYISTPLKQFFDTLPNKELKILIPGAGNAYEAEYLFQHGFKNVFVCDFAKEPLANLKKRCPLLPTAQVLECDFFDLDPSIHQFNLIIEQTFFCALDPALRQAYFKKMNGLLKKTGSLVGLLFNCDFEISPPYGGNLEEYKGYLKSYFTIQKMELCKNSIPARSGREIFINLRKDESA